MKTFAEINTAKTKPMDLGDLCLTMRNDRESWEKFLAHIKRAFGEVDATAVANAKTNAAWHDDASADDHRDYHASADKQYPFATRKADFLEALEYALDHLEDNRRKRYVVKFSGRERGAIGIATAQMDLVFAHDEEDAVHQLFYAENYRFEYMPISRGKNKDAMYCEVSPA